MSDGRPPLTGTTTVDEGESRWHLEGTSFFRVKIGSGSLVEESEVGVGWIGVSHIYVYLEPKWGPLFLIGV